MPGVCDPRHYDFPAGPQHIALDASEDPSPVQRLRLPKPSQKLMTLIVCVMLGQITLGVRHEAVCQLLADSLFFNFVAIMAAWHRLQISYLQKFCEMPFLKRCFTG